MRRRDFASDADYYRAHRQVFLLALELGCSPKDAEQEMALRRARERHRALQHKLDLKMNAQPSPRPADKWDARWMMRD